MDKLAMIRKLAWATAAFSMLALASCNAPGNSPAGAAAETDAPSAAPATAPLAEPQAQPGKAAPAAAPLPPAAPTAEAQTAPSTPMAWPEGKPGLPPSLSLGMDEGLGCRSDSDCVVKDAGSCCGYRPVCVNRDTPTFPENVKAACANEGRVGICGFKVIDGCECVAGKCAGVPMMENSVPVQ